MRHRTIRHEPTTRRGFLADAGMGFAGLALARCCTATASPEATRSRPPAGPHFAPKAKNVIWIFLAGGVSHVEGFDPKPALNEVRRA